MKSVLNRYVFSTHLKPFAGTFCDIADSHKLFIFQYLNYDDFLFSL